jgi:hypothetical protein
MAFLYALLYTIIPFSLGYYNLKELFGTKKGILILIIISIISLFIPIYHFLSFNFNLELFYYIFGAYWVGFSVHLLLNFKSGFVKIKRRLMYVLNLIFLGFYLNSMPIWNMSEIGGRLSPQSIENIYFDKLTTTNSIIISKKHAIEISKKSLNTEIKKGDVALKLNTIVEIDHTLVSLQKHNKNYYWIIPLKIANNDFGYSQYKVGEIPAYIMVDATKEKTNAELIKTYSDLSGKQFDIKIELFTDGYYGRNLERTIKLQNPKDIISSFSFQIDENKVPYAIAHVVEAGVGLANYIPTKIIAYNLITNSSKEYSFSNTPNWVSSISDLNTTLAIINDWGLYGNYDIISFFKGTRKLKDNNGDLVMIPINSGLGWFAEMTSTIDEKHITDIIVVDGVSLNVYLKTFNEQNISSSTLVKESIQGKLGKDSGFWTTSNARPYSLNNSDVWIVPIISKKDHSYIKSALVDFKNIGISYIDDKQSTVISKYSKYNQESKEDSIKTKLHLNGVIINNVNLLNQDGYNFSYFKLKNSKIYKNVIFSCNASKLSICLGLGTNEIVDILFTNKEENIFEIKDIQYSEIKISDDILTVKPVKNKVDEVILSDNPNSNF